jgi:hypothetical protein
MAATQQATHVFEEARAEIDRLIDTFSSESVLTNSYESPKAEIEQPAPAYVIISSKIGLTTRFGDEGFAQLDQDLQELAKAIETHVGLQVITIYVDDVYSLDAYRLQPVDAADPLQIKMLVDLLDSRLSEQGIKVHYILIVGGDSVIPFHRLPNPIDDQDESVPSDNPYASRDDNYFVPERAVGRMPDGYVESVDFLRSLIRTAIEGHKRPRSKGLLNNIVDMFWAEDDGNGRGQGYSASIWRRASRAVFKTIGGNQDLRTSPPLTYEEFKITDGPHLSYFNLHGIEDGAEWYGQRDALFPADYPLFPVALRPADLCPVESANAVVFTEACYGANILGKDTNTSIALRFLASRALALIGSTNISYGSIAPPLLGADLVGRHFWEGLVDHMTIGDALKYAKVALAKEMQDQQGYLDGEDQKTLISFVLYGDPSLPATAIHNGAITAPMNKAVRPSVICRKRTKTPKDGVSGELVAKVKSRIEASLPHMAQAKVRATPLHFCSGDCGNRCGHKCGSSKKAKGLAGNWALTLEKDLSGEDNPIHRQVVRVTVDKKGHIIKMAMSK